MPVKIICHRGWWKTPSEQNTLEAFSRAFDAGLGVELDVRDCNRRLVVSHDPPGVSLHPDGGFDVNCPHFTEVLDLLGDRDNWLVVNVKSCGLAPLFAVLAAPKNWVFFDMAQNDVGEYAHYDLPYQRELVISNELWGDDPLPQWGDLLKRNSIDTLLVTDLVREALEFFT